MKNGISLDKVDLRILEILQENAQTRFSDMASELNVSSGTIHVRTKKLREMGIIKGSGINLDMETLGYHLRATIGMDIHAQANLDEIVQKLKEIPEVLSCYSTTGRYSMLVNVASKNAKHLKKVLLNRISQIPGIEKLETFLSLEEHFVKPLELLNPTNGIHATHEEH